MFLAVGIHGVLLPWEMISPVKTLFPTIGLKPTVSDLNKKIRLSYQKKLWC